MDRLKRKRRWLVVTASSGFLIGLMWPVGPILLNGPVACLLAAAATVCVLFLAPWLRWKLLYGLLAILAALLILKLVKLTSGYALLLIVAGGVLYWLRPDLFDFEETYLPTTVTARAEHVVGLPQDEMWSRLIPAEAETHWDPQVQAVSRGPKPGVFHLHTETGHYYGAGRIPVEVFDVEQPTHFKQRDLSLPDPRDGGPVRVTSTIIEPEGDSTRVTLLEATWHPLAIDAAKGWLDDRIGNYLDRISAVLENRPDNAGSAAQPPARD